MKTWEVIKELTENKYKKFKTLDYYGKEMIAFNAETLSYHGISSDDIIATKDFDGTVEPLTLNDFIKDREWQEIKEAVSFIEAIESGKPIRVEHFLINNEIDYITKKYNPLADVLSELTDYHFSSTVRQILLEGKWYIE